MSLLVNKHFHPFSKFITPTHELLMKMMKNYEKLFISVYKITYASYEAKQPS